MPPTPPLTSLILHPNYECCQEKTCCQQAKEKLVSAGTSNTNPIPQSLQTPIRGLKIGTPEKFDGTRGSKSKTYGVQVALSIVTKPSMFPNDCLKIIFSILYLSVAASTGPTHSPTGYWHTTWPIPSCTKDSPNSSWSCIEADQFDGGLHPQICDPSLGLGLGDPDTHQSPQKLVHLCILRVSFRHGENTPDAGPPMLQVPDPRPLSLKLPKKELNHQWDHKAGRRKKLVMGEQIFPKIGGAVERKTLQLVNC
ncbi:uncharacterized protein VP01_1228g4 [Puccinia sorghi]|uniref:Uncharacterized protein n=1 Tax=Puccinia sorghi TaxID=27349 RepID=A0A0L6VPU6_9BASI|nr:uncharacterized protein VP01_1228g4 [Puccinia sorghi]